MSELRANTIAKHKHAAAARKTKNTRKHTKTHKKTRTAAQALAWLREHLVLTRDQAAAMRADAAALQAKADGAGRRWGRRLGLNARGKC